MKNTHFNYTHWRKRILANPQVKKEYDKLQPEFAIIGAIIEARMKKGMTQGEIAKKIGTHQSAIARLESGRANPSIKFLQKIANGFDMDVKLMFVHR